MKPLVIFRIALLAVAVWMASSSPLQAQNGPRYEAGVNWPKPLPHCWVLGGLGGLCVDAKDHVLILNRQDVIEGDLNGGTLAPPMIEFDPDGNVVNSWGDPVTQELARAVHHHDATVAARAFAVRDVEVAIRPVDRDARRHVEHRGW